MQDLRGLGSLPGRYLVAVGVVVVGFSAVAATVIDIRAVLFADIVVVLALLCWSDDGRLAWWWGFFLPIDFIDGVPPGLIDAVQFVGLAWLILRVKPDITPARNTYVWRFAALVGAVAVIRGIGSTARFDRFGMFLAAAMLIGAVTAPSIARRVATHVRVLAGFMGGVVLTAVVSLMQWLDIPTLVKGNLFGGSRYPGLASTTMLTTWHLAFGLIIAAYFLVHRGHRQLHRVTARVLLLVGVVALVGNGAQGGFLGLAAAAFFVGVWRWRLMGWRSVAPYIMGGLALVVVLVAVVLTFNISTPTIDGLRGDEGYIDETSRLEVDENGFREMVEHPLVGTGRTNFEDEYDLAPHFLPLEAGVTSGVVGFVVASVLLLYLLSIAVRGPVGRRPASWLGLALVGAMWSNTLIEMGGPFTGLPRFSLLLISIVACRGEPWSADDATRADAASSRPGRLETPIPPSASGPPAQVTTEGSSAATTTSATRAALPPSVWVWWRVRASRRAAAHSS